MGGFVPASLPDIAQQIADAMRIVTDAADASPGKLVHLDILPGLSPVVPTQVTGSLGAISPILNTAVASVKIGIAITVTVNGQPATASMDFSATPAISNNSGDPCSASISDPLSIAFMFKPPFAEDTYVNADALEYLIDVKICVKVEGTPVAKHIQIPVSMPPIRIPSIFLLSKPEHLTFSGDMGDWLFVMVEAGSSLQRLNDVATLLNKIADTLHAVGSLLSFASVFIDALNLAATAVNTIPKVFFHVGRYVEDMDDAAGVDIDDEARSCLLIGLASNTLTGKPTTVTLYSDTGFEDDHKVFLVTELVSGSVIGVNKQGSFSGIMFDNNGSHSIDQAVESFRFGGP